ncbi:MAG: glycosyltransferase [Clostridia bacterium]|nr:glycosyltransferase [Clostridia bacterium]
MNKPLVSILIPCYNHEAFLDDCIGSIINQDYENIEFYICDDASPDNSFAVICGWQAKLEERFESVTILKNEVNAGVTKNINRMLELSKGKYIKVLASDDAIAPDAISNMVEFLEENEKTDVLISNGYTVLEEEHYPNFTFQSKIYNEIPDFSEEDLLERVARCNIISAPAAFLRRKVFEEYGFYDETIKVEDFEFWLRILKDKKIKIDFLDKALIYYRINANSMTSSTNNKNLEKRKRLLFDSEIQSLYKYKDYFNPQEFAENITNRILQARWFAVTWQLKAFNAQLEKMWKEFSLWKAIPLDKRLKLNLIFLKQTVKMLIKR